MRTITTNESTAKQWRSADGQRVASIVKTGELFRLVEKSELWEPPTNGLEGYSYWTETYRSGLYPSAEAAEGAGKALVAWLCEADES